MRMKMGGDDNLPLGPPHLCVFRGLEHYEPDPKKTQPNYGPGWVWRMECVEGLHKGKLGTRVTGKSPTPRSACGRLLQMLVGRSVDMNTEVEFDQYVGRKFMVSMEAPESGGTRIASFYSGEGGALPQPQASTAPPPPPRQQATAERFWVALRQGQAPSLETRHDIQEWIVAHKVNPAAFDVCKEGQQAWEPASNYGFTDTSPF
jgi:hypothetical protein